MVVLKGYALAHVCQCRQAVLERAKESGERREKMLARRSEGRLLHIVLEMGKRLRGDERKYICICVYM